jgi:hypothetical protein
MDWFVYIKTSSGVKKTFTYWNNKDRDYTMSEPTVNIVKLAVGVKSVEELALVQRQFLTQLGKQGNKNFYHSTKLMPTKHEAIVKSGSLYWVVKGVICARQKILEITKQEDSDGVKRCRIYLDNSIIKTTPIRKRPFQGWRYLKKNKTPADIINPTTGTFDEDIPLEVQRQLLEVGLL